MEHRLIIFDFDGVLADSGPWFFGVLNQVAARHGFKRLAPEEIEALRGRPSQEVIRRLGVPAWKLPGIARHMRGLAAEAAGETQLFEGVEALLGRLKARGTQLGVVSSNAEANVRRVLGAPTSALVDHFECGASMFGKARLIRRVVRRSRVPASTVIAIGDEPRDVEAAHRAGVAAAAALWGYARAEAFAGLATAARFASVAEMERFLVAGG